MEQNNQDRQMNITAKVYPMKEPRENLLAFASVNVGDAFAIRGVKVLQGKNGPFVSMPQMKYGRGEWQDVCFPTTREGREAVNRAVLGEYQKSKATPAKAQNPQTRQSGAPNRGDAAR
jgi:stage V sporulation protein G